MKFRELGMQSRKATQGWTQAMPQESRRSSSLPVTDSHQQSGFWAIAKLKAGSLYGVGEGKRKCQKIKPTAKGYFLLLFPRKALFSLSRSR